MSRVVVKKFGGTSVATGERILCAAKRIADTWSSGANVVVVVSAMAGETNRLLSLGRAISPSPTAREMDALVSTGEQVTASLMAMALHDLGITARSYLGHQVGIHTDAVHSKARILSIDTSLLERTLEARQVAVIAGFQGVDSTGAITTLGRGGSDTSAVAIAAALTADVCEIYTDVEGVFTTDPGMCASARKIPKISHEAMLELASLGAKVLQIRSVEVAMNYDVPLHVRSSFTEAEGTYVVKEDSELEAIIVVGVAADENEVKVTVRSLPDKPGVVASLFEALAKRSIPVDMIIQNVSAEGTTDMTFTVTSDDATQAEQVARQRASEIGAGDVTLNSSVAKVSIVGSGMRSHAGVAAKMFRLLAAENINIQAISTSEIKVSCLVERKHAELAVRVLHAGFELERVPSESC